MSRASTITLLMVGALWPVRVSVASAAADDGYQLIQRLLSSSRQERESAARAVVDRADPGLVPGLVDAVFFTPKESRRQILEALEGLTGSRMSDYYAWVEYVGAHGEIEPAPGYLQWKRSLLARIDPKYESVFYDGAPARIRLEEIVWGGVPMAGIPALDDPPTLAGTEARYLRRKEKVFGIVVGGEARAYPLRFLSWHEMLNDTLGGEPITLSFCTLCGSGIFYLAKTPNGMAYRFDTSGLLYRSNKLMVDRRSRTLWSNLTGEPVVGRLARSPVRLEMLAGTLTTWQEWQSRHPDTTVLDLDGIEERMRPRYRYDYRPGAADRHRREVSFPVWLSSDELERDREIFALIVDGGAKAFPVDWVMEAEVVNEQVGGRPVAVVGDRVSGAVRAFERRARRFRQGEEGRLQDEEGGLWMVEEEGLRPLNAAAGEEVLPRLPGHQAYWFGWYAFYPQTEVWRK